MNFHQKRYCNKTQKVIILIEVTVLSLIQSNSKMLKRRVNKKFQLDQVSLQKKNVIVH